MADTQLYNVLGISRNATDSEIKKNYKKLAKEFHPDKNPAAGDRFKEISFAYEVLSDPQKRSIYDRYGLKGLQEGGGQNPQAFGESILSQFFSDAGFFGMPGMGMSFGGHVRKRRNDDTIHVLKVSLEDLYNGNTILVKIPVCIICSTCKGKGGKPGAVQACEGCKGRGIKVTYRRASAGMSQQIQRKCSYCNGEGEVFKAKDRCVECKGMKVVHYRKTFNVLLEKGMRENQKIIFRGEGDQAPDVEPGDVIIVPQEKPHDVFQRSGNNLIMNQTISLTEALCGFQLVVKHLDGRELVITHPPGEVIKPDTIKAVENEGMPIHKDPFEKGHLFIKFEIQFPVSSFIGTINLKKLEALLPPREQVVIPEGENVEEVNMYDFDPDEKTANDISAGESSLSDEDDHSGIGMQCPQQ